MKGKTILNPIYELKERKLIPRKARLRKTELLYLSKMANASKENAMAMGESKAADVERWQNQGEKLNIANTKRDKGRLPEIVNKMKYRATGESEFMSANGSRAFWMFFPPPNIHPAALMYTGTDGAADRIPEVRNILLPFKSEPVFATK